MGSTSDKISGKADQVIGKATDNKKLQAKGKAKETSGDAKHKLKKTGEKVSNKLNSKL